MEPTENKETKVPMAETKPAETPALPRNTKTTKKATPKKPKKSAENLTWKLNDIILSKIWNREKLGDITDLVASIKKRGLVQPLVVRRTDKNNKVELIAGRRRYAACQQLKMTDVPVVIREMDDENEAESNKDITLIQLAENLAREDNTDYEIAAVFDQLANEFGMTNEQIMTETCCKKSPGYVSQRLAVFKQSLPLQHALKAGKIPLSIFRHFTKIDQEKHKAFYDKMVSEALKGTPAQELGDKIDFFVAKETKKEVAKAEKEGKKAKIPAKRGGAAKKKKGPRFQITDYTLPENKKLIKVQATKTIVEGLEFATTKLQSTSSKHSTAFWQGYVAGLELAGGITVLEDA